MFNEIRKRANEYHSLCLALFFVFFNVIIRTTTLAVFQCFGLDTKNLRILHLEALLWTTTTLIVGLICGAFYFPAIGWILVVIGVLRITQIISLNAFTLLFGFRLLGPSVSDPERARWHFVAILFSIIDVLLIYGFFFYFFNRSYQILNIPADKFLNHFYYSVITIATVGYGDIVPVKTLGRILAISETAVGIFLFVFLLNAAMSRFQRLHE